MCSEVTLPQLELNLWYISYFYEITYTLSPSFEYTLKTVWDLNNMDYVKVHQ